MPVAKRDPDFLQTMERMYRDAKILFEKGEYYNSCYLSGYVLECTLKFLLCHYGRKSNGERYTWTDVKKKFSHGLKDLNQALEECLAVTEGIPPQYRLDSAQMCPYIFCDSEERLRWNPAFRYGEYPAWDTREYCEHYIEEIEALFRFVGGIIAGGI